MTKRYEHKLKIYHSLEEYDEMFVYDLKDVEEKGYELVSIFSHDGAVEVWFKKLKEVGSCFTRRTYNKIHYGDNK